MRQDILVYMWLCLYVCVCVCVWLCEWVSEKREWGRTRATFTNGLIDFLFESRGEVSDGRDWEVESPWKRKARGGRKRQKERGPGPRLTTEQYWWCLEREWAGHTCRSRVNKQGGGLLIGSRGAWPYIHHPPRPQLPFEIDAFGPGTQMLVAQLSEMMMIDW